MLRVSERLPPLPGGKEIHVAELTRHQVAAGDVVHIAYRWGDGDAIQATSANRVRVPRQLRGAVGAALFAIGVAVRMRAHPEVDVVHLHGDFTEIVPLSWLARRRGARLVMTVHGGMNARYRRVSRSPLRRVDRFIALGQTVADDLVARGVPATKIEIMSSGLNTELLDSSIATAVKPGLVVSVGSLNQVKNHEHAIRSVLALPPDIAVRLEIIGEGPDRQRLEEVAAGSGRIRFMGHLSRREVYERVSRAQIFVLASRSTGAKAEGVPTALLEAMHLKCHCLVSNGALPTPIVTDTSSFEIFDPESAELTSLLVAALRDPGRSVGFGLRAQEAVAGLDWANVTEHVRDVLTRAGSQESE